MLDRKFEKEYTERGQTFFENHIDATFRLPPVPFEIVEGCEVTLTFAREENPCIEKRIMRILEHGMIGKMSTGGN